MERYLPDAFGGKAAQVHLHVLGIIDLDAVQEDAGVLASEAADVDGLEAADPAVVLDLDSGETPDDVRHLDWRRRCQTGFFRGADDGAGFDGANFRRRQRIRLLGHQGGGGGHEEQSRTY